MFWMHNTLFIVLLSLLWMWQHKFCVSCVLEMPDDTWLTLAGGEAERSRDCVLIYYLVSNLTVIICRLLPWAADCSINTAQLSRCRLSFTTVTY